MLTGEIRSQIDAIWNAFWTGGISNPLEVIEQITYLLFLRRLDDLQTLEENKAARLGKPIQRHIFPKGKDTKGRPYQEFRLVSLQESLASSRCSLSSAIMFSRSFDARCDDSTTLTASSLKDARFHNPTPALLRRS